MSDEDVVKGEEAKLRRERQSKLSRSIWRQWTDEGYDQYAHMQGVEHAGDAAIFRGWCSLEGHPHQRVLIRGKEGFVQKPVELVHWMAHRDMADLWSDYHRKTFREREQTRATG